MSEFDALLQSMEWQEKAEIDTSHGQSILDAISAKQEKAKDPVIEALLEGHRAAYTEDESDA